MIAAAVSMNPSRVRSHHRRRPSLAVGNRTVDHVIGRSSDFRSSYRALIASTRAVRMLSGTVVSRTAFMKALSDSSRSARFTSASRAALLRQRWFATVSVSTLSAAVSTSPIANRWKCVRRL